MFSASESQRPNRERGSFANDAGYNDAWLGIANQNPFPVNSIDYRQYEWGYNEALDDINELDEAPAFYPSNEYEEWI